MKVFYILGGLFVLIFVCIIPLPKDLAEYRTQKNGKMVKVVITGVPDCNESYLKHFITFRFDNVSYSKRTTDRPCDEFKRGDTILLKHTMGTDVFLYENETKESEFVSTGILALAAILLIIIGIKRKQ